MKKLNVLLLVTVILLGMTQCKKKVDTIAPVVGGKKVDISLKTGKSRVIITPHDTYATVDFEDGDIIYVGNNGKYVGNLVYDEDNQQFSGTITDPVESDYLHFYFFGDCAPGGTITAGSTTKFTVSIADQVTKTPVVSYAPSTEKYSSKVSSYSAVLQNKCALIKLNVTTTSSSPTRIKDFKNGVEVDFGKHDESDNGFRYGYFVFSGDYNLAVSGGSGEKWVVVLPQEELAEGTMASVYSEDGTYYGTRPAIPEIIANTFNSDAIDIECTTFDDRFSISSNQKVWFSPGNLQYIGSAATPYWKFADHQYDYLGDNGQASTATNVDRDLFAWGTGNNPNKIYYDAVYYDEEFGYSADGQFTWHEWGSNTISNGGEHTWFTMESYEWTYLLETRSASTVNGTENARYAKAKVNDVYGLIVFPDQYTHPTGVTLPIGINSTSNTGWDGNNYSASDWEAMEEVGAVFLPAAGQRSLTFGDYCAMTGVTYTGANSVAAYWSKTEPNVIYSPEYSPHRGSYSIWITKGIMIIDTHSTYWGYAVRLVRKN